MSSEQFYREFEAGNLGDEGDFFEWKAKNRDRLVKHVKSLNVLYKERRF